jgi:hypothetical protein
MNIYIAHKNLSFTNKKSLFILTRPFLKDDRWCNDEIEFQNMNTLKNINYVLSIEQAHVVFLPFSINYYFENKQKYLLKEINAICKALKINIYGFISGDFGIKYPDFSNIFYFRMGGFKSKLSNHNLGFIVSLSDHFLGFFKQEHITPKLKQNIPIVGFCGHASFSSTKKLKEVTKFVIENVKRFIKNPLYGVYEPLFSSAFERAKLLKSFAESDGVKTNFIYRNNYRGGAKTQQQRTQTTLEYYNNILNSDYILCVRGAGNFSVRFYETLMMGKIPIFVNTDCLIPFEDKIKWKKHVVWVEWHERHKIVQKVIDFHQALSPNEFVNLQLENRQLWKEKLSIKSIINMIEK